MLQVIGEAVLSEFPLDLPAGAAHAAAVRAPALDHEARDDPVEDQAVIKSLLDQVDEVVHGVGRDLGVELRLDNAAIFHFNGDDGIAHWDHILSYPRGGGHRFRLLIARSISRLASRAAAESRLS